MHNNNIDNFIQNKANAYEADKSFMLQNFAAIKNALPTAPNVVPVKANPKWFALNNIIGAILITGITLLAILFISKNKNKQTINEVQITQINTTNATNTIESDTPIIVNEIPKDPKTAPKKWVYKMQINFDGKTKTSLPPKKYIDLSDIKDANNDIEKKQDIEKGKVVLQNFISQLASPKQVFTINNQQAHNITCTNGTKLIIKPNTFTSIDKKTVQGNVDLEVKEAYSYTDMIANNLHTVSNGNLLQSGGMVFINATQNAAQLDIDISNPIQLQMPTTNKKDSMQLFNLDNNNWVANGQLQSAIFNINNYNSSKYIGNNKFIKIKYKNKISIISVDSVGKLMNTPTTNHDTIFPILYENTKSDSIYIKNENNYNFNIRNFNWINCDRFINNKNNIDFVVEYPNKIETQKSVLIFTKLKSTLNGFALNNKVDFNKIPKNEDVYFIAFQYHDNKVLTCIQQLTTSKEPAKAEDFIELTPVQVKAKLDALGSVK